MTRKKTLLVSVVCFSILLSGIFITKGYPITFISSEIANTSLHYDSSIFNPLQGNDVNSGDWSVYLIIDKFDYENLTPALTNYKVCSVSSVSALKSIQASWNFKPTRGDMATVTSSVIIVHDQKIVFESGIVLDKNAVGLQSEHFGWAELTDQAHFAETLKEFRKVQSPFVFI